MQMEVRFDGHQAIDHIVAVASPALRAGWDGKNERVAFIIEQKDGMMAVGFWPRIDAPAAMRRLADGATRIDLSVALRAAASTVEEPPPSNGYLQCLLFGWQGCAMLEIHPDDLDRSSAGIRPDDYIESILAARDPDHAAKLLGDIERALADAGAAPLDELRRLRELVGRRWHEPAALALAIGKAHAETTPYLATPAGQRARSALNALMQANADRGGPLNAPRSGSA